jgi:hypothetical protein
VAASAQNVAGEQDEFVDMAMKKNGLPSREAILLLSVL